MWNDVAATTELLMAAFRMGDVSLPHKLCLTKRNMSPFAEAAKALLSSPLPPELVVDFKGSIHSSVIRRNVIKICVFFKRPNQTLVRYHDAISESDFVRKKKLFTFSGGGGE